MVEVYLWTIRINGGSAVETAEPITGFVFARDEVPI